MNPLAPWNDPSVRWVCENHPTKDQGHRVWLFWECGGAGMPEKTKENIEKGYIPQRLPPLPKSPTIKPPKKRKLGTCLSTNKQMYTEALAKQLASQKSNAYLKIRPYSCAFCTNWHITHKKNKLSMH